MDYGYINNTSDIEISDAVINEKLEEIINKPDSVVATKKELEDLKNNIVIETDFGVF